MARLLSPHFSEDEFWCHGSDQGTCSCGHQCYVDPKLLEALEQLRYNIGGYPLEISSGYRCRQHNRAIGGASNSQHCQGTAADVICPAQLSMGEFVWYASQLPFDGFGIYDRGGYGNGWLHLDCRYGYNSWGPIQSRDYWEG